MPAVEVKMELDQDSLHALSALLDKLPANIQRRVIGKACKMAIQPVIKAARRHAPLDDGTLRHRMGLRQKKYGRTGTTYTVVGVQRGTDPATGENPSVISHLVEYGTTAHLIAPRNAAGALKIKRGRGPTQWIEGAVWHPGARMKPFMRPAYHQNKEKVVQIWTNKMDREIAREADRLSWGK